LAEVYAAVVSGSVTEMNEPEQARWKLRLLAEAGLTDVVPIELPQVPEVSASVTKVYEGFRTLLMARSITEGLAPAPFTASFVSRWCGVTEQEAEAATRYLIRHGVIAPVAKERFGRWPTNLYLPASAVAAALGGPPA
jgi:hypothetical protein